MKTIRQIGSLGSVLGLLGKPSKTEKWLAGSLDETIRVHLDL